MADNAIPALIPKAEQYLDAELNVMLIGWHGVGKTEELLRLARDRGLKLKYYSCSTLDPFTDLVGVPVPRVAEDGTEYLKMVRPRDIDEAEVIFFDELNRADDKVRNALMEIILFGSINGEKLPNLKCVWAAINPPEEGNYDVEELDPALLDRFHVYVEINARPNVKYMTDEAKLPKPIAQALFSWWSDHNGARRGIEHYISPRRLVTIGKVFMATGSFENAIPKWINADKGKLRALLQRAQADMKATEKGVDTGDEAQADEGQDAAINAGANPSFTYDDNWMKDNSVKVAAYLTANPDDLDTHKAVLSVLEKRHAPRLAKDYVEVLDALKPSLLEGFVSGMNAGRFDLLRKKIGEVDQHRLDACPTLKKVLSL